MENLKISVEQIKELMQAMRETGLGELSVADGDFKLRLFAKKQPAPVINMSGNTGSGTLAEFHPSESEAMAIITGADGPSADEASAAASSAPTVQGNVMKSPIVGTFYASPSPDKAPFVEVGQKVKKGDVLFIIESMKLMNEIQSEYDGEVVEILCENGQAVEFGQPIMLIK